jgi:hypothetical protein
MSHQKAAAINPGGSDLKHSAVWPMHVKSMSAVFETFKPHPNMLLGIAWPVFSAGRNTPENVLQCRQSMLEQVGRQSE